MDKAPYDITTAEGRAQFGLSLKQEIDTARLDRDKHRQRLNRLLSYYLNLPEGAKTSPAAGEENLPEHNLALIQPNIDQAVAIVVQTIFGPEVWMRCKTRAGTDVNERLENTLQQHVENSRLPWEYVHGLTYAYLYGSSLLRCRYKSTGEDEQFERLAVPWYTPDIGLDIEAYDTFKSLVWPMNVNHTKDAKGVGHVELWRKSEIVEKRKAGEFLKDPEGDEDAQMKHLSSDVPDADEAETMRVFGQLDPMPFNDSEDGQVRVWHILWKGRLTYSDRRESGRKFKKTDERARWHRFRITETSGILLEHEPYQHTMPWYILLRASALKQGAYPIKSKAQDLHGIQILYNEAHNAAIDAALDAAGPPVFGDFGAEERKSYKRKEVIDTDSTIAPWSPNTNAQIAGLVQMIPQLETVAARITRISQTGLASELKSSTATEATILNRGQQYGSGSDVGVAIEPLVDLYRLIRELLWANYDDWAPIFTNGAREVCSKEELEMQIDFTPAGVTPDQDPMLLVQKLQTWTQFCAAFTAEVVQVLHMHGVDTEELLKSVYNQLDIGDIGKIMPEGGTGPTLTEIAMQLGAMNGTLGSQLGALSGVEGGAPPQAALPGGPGGGPQGPAEMGPGAPPVGAGSMPVQGNPYGGLAEPTV